MATDIIIQIVQQPALNIPIEIAPGSQVTWASVVGKPSTFPPSAHGHAIPDISGLQTILDGKAPLIHFHVIADVTGLQGALDGKAASSHTHAISDVTNLLTTLNGKADLSHIHVIADVTGLQGALDGKAAASHTHIIADTTGLQIALDGKAALSHTHIIANVTGLQTALDSKQAAGSYAAASHTHIIADITGLQTGLDGKAALSHSHVIADITGLQSALDGKQVAGAYAAATHSHVIADITGLQTTLDQRGVPAGGTAGQVLTKVNGTNYNVTWTTPATGGGSVAWADITGKPSQFPPETHTHGISDVTGLQTALDGKAATSHTHAIADVTGLQTLLDAANGTALNQATVKLVRKASAGTITKGQVVYIVGSQGTHLTVELADADAEATAATTIGVAMGNITSTVDGYIIVQGFLDGLNNLPTATFTDGQALWLSSTAGAWTNTRPTQPAHGVFLGWVVSASNGASGRAYIKVINGQELDELHDVLITSPSEGQVLTYESSTGLWKNKTASGGGGGITNEQSVINALIFG